jgi:hypothetical protein
MDHGLPTPDFPDGAAGDRVDAAASLIDARP